MTRRTLVLALLLALVSFACGRHDDRCALCGMPISPQSAWRADLLEPGGAVRHYDSPRCALTAWRSGKVPAADMRVLDYYDRQWHDANDLLFVVGSDVMGPMGPDLVPVDRARAPKFAADHGAGRPLQLSALTAELLAQMR